MFTKNLHYRQVSTTYAVNSDTNDDFIIEVYNITGNVTIYLPAGPALGDCYIVKDTLGQAGTFNIFVDGGRIDSVSAPRQIVNPYGSMIVMFMGGAVGWSILASHAL